VQLMYAAGNGVSFGCYGAAALGRSLTALASLRDLDISCKPRTFSVQFCCVRVGGVSSSSVGVWYLMPAAGNCLGTEGVAALGQSMTALTALLTLNLSGKAR
jgi:hypothetical protein